MAPLSGDFVFGFWVGISACVVLYFVYRGILWSTKSLRAFFSPQVICTTSRATPFQVFLGWAKGCVTLLLIAALLVVLVLVAGGQEIRSAIVPIAIFLALIFALNAMGRR